jgi:stage III sporulation protein AE
MIPLLVLALAVLLARPAQAAESDVLVRQGEALELDKLAEAAGEYAPGDAGAQVDLNEGLQSILDTGSGALWGVVRKAGRSGILLLTVVLLCALGDGPTPERASGQAWKSCPLWGHWPSQPWRD